MLVDDEPIPEVEMARATEQHARTTEFGRLCNLGHVRVIEDNDPLNIRCRIEDEVFAEPRDIFPSVQLMARLQLAIAAGQTCRKIPRDPADAHRYYASGIIPRKSVNRAWLNEHYGASDTYSFARADAIAQGYANVWRRKRGKVTATVKGLRP